MGNPFEDKTAKVVVVDTSGAVRQLLSDVARTQDFKNVQGVGSIKEVIHILEVEPVDWVITPLNLEAEPNAIQLLPMVIHTPALKGLRISLILAEEEFKYLPNAFEYGLLNYFTKPFNKETISAEINDLLGKFVEFSWDATRVSAYYLKRYLNTQPAHDITEKFCRDVLALYPGQCRYMMDLAKPLAAMGKADESRQLLRQVQVIDSTYKKECDAIIQEYLQGDAGANDGQKMNVLGISHAVVVDADEASNKAIKEALLSLGVPTVKTFDNGEDAFKAIGEEEPGLVLHEWRIPKLTGPLFVQRVRGKYAGLPMIVVSSLVAVEDMPLLKEMGVANIVKKPISKDQLNQVMIHTIQQNRMPTEVEALEMKIRQLLEVGDLKEAEVVNQRYQAAPGIPKERRAKIEAEIAFHNGSYEKARDLAVLAIKTQADSVVLLNLLGKTLMKLNDFSSALKCFQKAQTMSPMNLKRLCTIAEAHSELGQKSEAARHLDEAKAKDAGSDQVKESAAKIALNQGDAEAAKEIMGELESIQKILSYMNNRAVAYSRSGQLEEGIKLYKKTIESIPDNKNAVKPVVYYNLALAYVRNDLLQAAVKILDKVIAAGQSKVGLKAKALKVRVAKAIKSGGQVDLNENAPKAGGGEAQQLAEGAPATVEGEENPSAEQKVVQGHIEISVGELCCFKLFAAGALSEAQAEGWLAKPPQYKPRKVIERGATGGLEREMKSTPKE